MPDTLPCEYCSPDSGQGCALPSQLTSTTYPYEGKHYCLFHHPGSLQEKETLCGGKTQLTYRFADLFKQVIAENKKIVIEGVVFDQDPGLILRGINQTHIEMRNCLVRSDFVFRPGSKRIDHLNLNGLCVQGDFSIPTDVGLGNWNRLCRITIEGSCHLAPVHISELESQNVVVAGDFTFEPDRAADRSHLSIDVSAGGKVNITSPQSSDGILSVALHEAESINFKAARNSTLQVRTLPEHSEARIVGDGATVHVTLKDVERNSNHRIKSLTVTGTFDKFQFSETHATNLVATSGTKFNDLTFWCCDIQDYEDTNRFSGASFNGISANKLYAFFSSIPSIQADNSTFHKVDINKSDIYQISLKNSKVNYLKITGDKVFFINAPVDPNVDDSIKCIDKFISYDTATVSGVDFRNRIFRGDHVLSKTDFRNTPDYINASFEGNVVFPLKDTDYPVKQDYAAASYRNLKNQMEKTRNRHAQGMFHALEMRSIRRQKVSPPLENLISFLYDKASVYGYSAKTAFLNLGKVSLLAFLVYWLIHADMSIDIRAPFDFDAARSAAVDTLRQTVVPFHLLRKDDTEFWLILFSTFHSVIAVILVALAFLAIRWKFRRG